MSEIYKTYSQLIQQLAVVLFLACFATPCELVAQRKIGQDTFANSVSEYIGLSFRSPNISSPSHTLGEVSGGTDLHFGLQYNRSLPLGYYALVRFGIVRYQNKMDYIKTVNNLLTNADSLYLETIVTDYNYTNSYIMGDAGLGIGKIMKLKAWALDVNVTAMYRAFTSIAGNRINALEEDVEYNASEFTIPSAHLVFGADAALRWYMDREAYFTFGLGYQLATKINHTESGAIFNFSALAYKIGYGFDF